MNAYEHLAERLRSNPDFLAYWFQRAAEQQGKSLAEVLAALGVLGEQQPHICICKAPRSGHQQEDLAKVAERFGVNVETLAQVIGS